MPEKPIRIEVNNEPLINQMKTLCGAGILGSSVHTLHKKQTKKIKRNWMSANNILFILYTSFDTFRDRTVEFVDFYETASESVPLLTDEVG